MLLIYLLLTKRGKYDEVSFSSEINAFTVRDFVPVENDASDSHKLACMLFHKSRPRLVLSIFRISVGFVSIHCSFGFKKSEYS